jgi:hypothetical protein
MVRYRRAFGDAMISISSVALLLMLLVTIDPRVREQVAGVWSPGGGPAVMSARGQVREITSVVLSAARDNGVDNAPLMVFALAATVLTLFMLRT